MHEVLRLSEDYRSYRAVKKLNTRAQELTVRMKNKGIWGKVCTLQLQKARSRFQSWRSVSCEGAFRVTDCPVFLGKR